MEGREPAGVGGEESVDFAVSFEDVSVFQRIDGEREKVISNVTDCVHSGDVLAIVGPSSQTQLLLDTLRGIYVNDNSISTGYGVGMTGRLSWNGQSPEDVDPRALAYVDVKEGVPLLSETLSCWEVLYFTIKTRVAFLSTGEQSAMVDQVLDMVALAEVADVAVQGLSELQKRCLCIAREIVGCAGIVFLLEPLEGLSALDARQLLGTLNVLSVSYGYAILATLPSIPWRTVTALKHVLVLSEDGRVLYQGPITDAQSFLAVQAVDCKGESVSDLLVHVVHALPGSHQDALVVANADSEPARAARRLAVDVRSGRVPLPPLVLRGMMPALETGDLRWLLALLDLEWRVLRGDPMGVQRYVLAPLLLGFVLGLLFFRLPTDPVGEGERVGVCFVLLVLFGIDAGLGRTALEGRMMWSEVCAGRLALAVHAVVTAYGELLLRRTPPAVLLPVPLLLLAALAAGFGRCVGFVLVCVAATWSCSALAIALWLLVAGLRAGSRWGQLHSTTLGAASAVGVAVMVLVAGFPLSPRDMPWHIGWLRYLSPFAYSLDAMANAIMDPEQVEAAGFPVVSPGWHLARLALLCALYILLALAPSILAQQQQQQQQGAGAPQARAAALQLASADPKLADDAPYQGMPFLASISSAVDGAKGSLGFASQRKDPDSPRTPLNP